MKSMRFFALVSLVSAGCGANIEIVQARGDAGAACPLPEAAPLAPDAPADVQPPDGQAGDAVAGECKADADCAAKNTACAVFRCMSQACVETQRDDDGDGVPSCAAGKPGAADCNDADAAIHPGAKEVCGDFVDQNCNGTADEGCFTFCAENPTIGNDAQGWVRGCCAAAGSFAQINGAPKPGVLIRGDDADPSVFYVASNGKLYQFSTIVEFVSWFGKLDLDGVPISDPAICGLVRQIPKKTLEAMPFGAYIGIRPGTFVVSVLDPDKWHAVSKGGKLRLLGSEKAARDIFGQTFWKRAKRLIAGSATYTDGPAVTNASQYNRAAELATTLEQDLGLAP